MRVVQLDDLHLHVLVLSREMALNIRGVVGLARAVRALVPRGLVAQVLHVVVPVPLVLEGLAAVCVQTRVPLFRYLNRGSFRA